MSKNIEPTSQVATRSGIITTAGTLLPANLDRRGVIVQNLGTNPLFVKFGSGASTTSFDVVLKGGNSSDDGNGGSVSFDVLSFTGIISVAGTSPRCTGTDF